MFYAQRMYCIECSSPNESGHKAVTQRNTKIEWTGNMLSYIQSAVGNPQTMVITGVGSTATQVPSGQIGWIQRHCNVMQLPGRWPSAKSLRGLYTLPFWEMPFVFVCSQPAHVINSWKICFRHRHQSLV